MNTDVDVVDRGEVPPQLKAQQEAQAAIERALRGGKPPPPRRKPPATIPSAEIIQDDPDADGTSSPDPLYEPQPEPEPKSVLPKKLQTVMLDCPFCQLEFEVYGVSIKDHIIVLDLPLSAPLFQPKDVAELDLIVGGRRYPVMYVGGNFDFPWRKLRAMAFLRSKPKAENDQERKSRNQEDAVSD